MKIRMIGLALGLAGLSVAQPNISALALTYGTPITGSIQFGGASPNYFNPANGFVPSGQGYSNAADASNSNIVPLSTNVEFGFYDGSNRDTADFTATGLTIQDIAGGAGSIPATYSFTSSEFSQSVFTLISNSFINGVTYSLIGNTFTVNTPGFAQGGTYTAQFQIASANAVPFDIPGGATIPAIGGLLALGAMRKAKRASP